MVAGYLGGQGIRHPASVRGGVGQPLLGSHIRGGSRRAGRRRVVLQMYPAPAPGDHRRIEQHCLVHDVRL